MNDITYTIDFYSYWHCGSGLGAGATADAVVLKDKDGLPYIPGKTIKGLVREAVEAYSGLENVEIERLFGTKYDGKNVCSEISPGQGMAYFTNAVLGKDEAAYIVQEKLQPYLYKNMASTAIDETTGTVKDASLRTLEVTVPCSLHGRIMDVEDGASVKALHLALRLIKRIGVNRNRGLGRCDIKPDTKGGEQ